MAHPVSPQIQCPKMQKTGQKFEILGMLSQDIILIGSGQDVGLCMQTKELLLKWSSSFYEQLHNSPTPSRVQLVLLATSATKALADAHRDGVGCTPCV